MARHSTPFKKQSGFSLLEATASIVLLSTMTAAALPKFEKLEEQAKLNGESYVKTAQKRAEELNSIKRNL